ncbi:MAG: hypothetical protein AAGI08_04975 [Bacteroidota bacterium]
MSRIIKTGDTPAKRRRAHLRSCAEVLRLLATRATFDEEAQDMAAFMAFNLRGVYDTIEESVRAWEDRNYWKKAEDLRHKWLWARTAADDIETAILANRWAKVQDLLIGLVPHFVDVNVGKMTRDADWWVGAHAALRRR